MFATIRAWFSGFSAKVAAFLSGPGGRIFKSAIGNAVEVAGAVALSVLAEEAKRKVVSLDPMDVPNSLKRDQAVDYMSNYARSAGKAVGESIIRLLVETAVQSLKAEKSEE